jgi:hypothetical protein
MHQIGHQKGEGELKNIDDALKLKAAHLALPGAVIQLGFRYHRMAHIVLNVVGMAGVFAEPGYRRFAPSSRFSCG